jgi:uncharacterized RDD family membrane protein YckC
MDIGRALIFLVLMLLLSLLFSAIAILIAPKNPLLLMLSIWLGMLGALVLLDYLDAITSRKGE